MCTQRTGRDSCPCPDTTSGAPAASTGSRSTSPRLSGDRPGARGGPAGRDGGRPAASYAVPPEPFMPPTLASRGAGRNHAPDGRLDKAGACRR
ncbi:hypothetical protein TPA0910_78630 [Streptomyces hygroscopicus subsp. sporocinereus]|uniref:Uncharacterized protein n=1 Tax=Streptomyces hygroscopicus TaxID=1912 RepID=A0ABQ3UCU5_STRHY|nr:hypothetical protein TPA0910_78630 [Streptomyces hygroscopicus]